MATTPLRNIIPNQGMQKEIYTQEADFYDEVEASWDLQWFGQSWAHMFDGSTYMEQPEDPHLDIEGQLEGTHYEQYRDHFDDVRNQEHFDVITHRIDYNNHQREVRDDAGILPELVAALGDPLTYVPLPFAKGVTALSRFGKGGLMTGALVGASEPIRHALDPTATMDETMSYIGAGFVMGGGVSAAFGRRLSPKVSHNLNQQDAFESSAKAHWDTENDTFTSGMYDEKSGVKYQVSQEDLTYEYKLDTANVTQKDDVGVRKFVHIKRASDKRSRVENDTIVIDEARIHKAYQDESYRVSKTPGLTNLPKFASPEDLKKFLIEKETIKFIKGAPKGKNKIDAENLLNKEALENVNASNIKRNIAGTGKGRSIWAERVDRWVTDFGELTNNKMRNTEVGNRVADIAVNLFGDAGVVSRAAKFGLRQGHSSLTRATLNHFQAVGNFNKAQRMAYKEHRKILTEGQKTILDYDPVMGGQKIKDIVGAGIDKIKKAGGNNNVQARMSYQEFKEITGRAMGDPEFRALQSEAIQKFAADAKVMYDEIGKQAKDLGLFQSQKVVSANREKFVLRRNNIEFKIEGILGDRKFKDLKPKEKTLVEELQGLRNRADDEIRDMRNLERDLELKLIEEFDPLIENYVNRVYDVDNVLKDITVNDVNFLPPTKINNPIKVKNGMVKGMVVGFRNEVITEDPLSGKILSRRTDRDQSFANIEEVLDDGKIVVTFNGKKKTIGKNDYTLRSIRIDKIDKRFYSIPDEKSLRGKIYKHYEKNPEVYKFKNEKGEVNTVVSANDTYSINLKVQNALDDIVDDTQGVNMENDLGIRYEGSSVLTGATNLMSRKLNMTDKELEGFLVRDINYLFRQYSDRMYKRIEVARSFGDTQMKTKLWDTELDMLLNEGVDNLPYIKETMLTLRNSRDKVYNIYNTGDPSSFFKSRLPHSLRNWGSLAMMGVVYLSSLVDAGRMPMVHGWADTMKVLNAKNPFSAHSVEINKALEANKYLADAFDVTMNDVSVQRLISQQERVGSGTTVFGRFFDKIIGKPLDKLQSPFYHANFLSGHTQLMKQWCGHISASRFLEDSIKVSKGTATEFEITRLLDYGISKQEARAIARLPIQKTKNGLHFLPEADALANKNGKALTRKLRYATFSDVQRTIITPSVADKPNMMFGVIRIKNEELSKVLDNDMMKFFGFEKTEVGGKINNGFLALPLQFFAWSFASNRKLVLSGVGGREASLVKGGASMYALAMLGDYLKNPTYWEHKSTEEKMYRAIEMSGLLGLPGDFNFMLETVSEGMFDTPMGIRPIIGTPGRFGEVNAADATGEFVGAAPGMLADLIYAFDQNLPFDEKANTIRRLIPFNNLLWFKGIFGKIYDTGAETLR